ncbi:hypothetical protein H0H93_014246 [Arthromyces matolae]|nr:hypothetical protein H0H93_014246 [Arthromyces matolae]
MLLDYLAVQTTEYSVQVFSKIIQSLGCLISSHSSESKFFLLKWDDDDFATNAVLHFIHLFMNIAKPNKKVLNILSASNILGILRPFLEMEMRDDPERRMAIHQDDLLTVYDESDCVLLELIKEHGLGTLLKALPEGVGDAFVYRRILLCKAFKAFLAGDCLVIYRAATVGVRQPYGLGLEVV